MDPVTLGLCSQIDLDLEVKRASKGQPGDEVPVEGTMLMSAEEALATANGRTGSTTPAPDSRRAEHDEQLDADSVFAKLKSLKGDATNP
jgi:hypothetical protein